MIDEADVLEIAQWVNHEAERIAMVAALEERVSIASERDGGWDVCGA
jgi:hypothetical protein